MKTKGVTHGLFICPICNRVYESHRSSNGLKLTRYISNFPKMQKERICNECKRERTISDTEP